MKLFAGTGRLYTAVAVCAVLAAVGGTTGALAAGGKALGVNPAANVQTKTDTKVLTVGSDLFIGDRVITAEYGQVQIKFDDGTELVVGPNSSMLLEDYLLRSDGSAGKLAINALAGTFRFVTGSAPKDKYLIKTPTGTIGVRGTAFDFNVTSEGTKVLLYHGGVIMCNLDNTCIKLDGTCEVGTFDLTDAEVIGPTSNVTGQDRRDLQDQFKYAQSQSPLLNEFWIEKARQCLNKPFVGGTPEGPGVTNSAPVGDEPNHDCYDYDGETYCGGF
ncbi:FecR family protein [Devosia sp.]|uniref:FecR family protein n=1 Tax=Devosia sp. TaxID=1871048 RepID=UPI003BAC0DAB